MKHFYNILLFLFTHTVFAQTNVLLGSITDAETGLAVNSASIVLSNNAAKTVFEADSSGKFKMDIPENCAKCELTVTAPGFQSKTFTPSGIRRLSSIQLSPMSFTGNEVVISASRYSDKYLEAPSTIAQINAAAIRNAASGDYFESMANLKNVQMIGGSFTFKVFNSRGFGTSSPFRIVQFTDGMDMQSPGLTFAPGKMLAAPDIDIDNIEVISGPASALYGPNAFQGVVSMNTVDPHKKQVFSASVKGGSNNFFEAEALYANLFGKKKRFGLKVAASYMMAKDWQANDPATNSYLPVFSPPQNLNNLVAGFQNNDEADFTDFNNYTAANPNARPNATPAGTQFRLKPYAEADMWDRKINTFRTNVQLSYEFSPKLRLSYKMRLGRGDGIYQGNNRAVLKNLLLHQHYLELKHKDFFIKAYTTHEDGGDCYDLVLAGINLAQAGLPQVNRDYLKQYVNTIDSLSGGFANAVNTDQVTYARNRALAATANSWLQPGTERYDTTFKKIIASRNRPAGARYTSFSNLQHLEAQYDLKTKYINANFGAYGRRYQPVSQGYIFDDLPDSNSSRKILQYFEYGGFVQLSKSFFENKLSLLGSFRLDKSQNYNFQFSPRFAIMMNYRNHHLRVAVQSAFRSPTLNDQYFNLNTGALVVKGNLSGYDNVYTQTSVDAYLADAPPLRNPAKLQTIVVPAVKPENLISVELGYRTFLFNKLMIDVDAYYNRYNNFIANINLAQPRAGVAGDSSGVSNINIRNFTTLSVPVNATTPVNTFGAALSVRYNVWKSLHVYTNYTFTFLDTAKINDALIPGFNTPTHRINVGVEASKIWKGLGFGVNFRWVDGYEWRSPFTDRAARLNGIAETVVPAYHTLDLQVNYTIDRIYSTIRAGASNIYNNKHIEMYGGGVIGGFYYASWNFILPL